MPHVMAHPRKSSHVFPSLPRLAAEWGRVCMAVFSTVRCSVLSRWCCGPPTCAPVGAVGPAWREAPLFTGGGGGGCRSRVGAPSRGWGGHRAVSLFVTERHLCSWGATAGPLVFLRFVLVAACAGAVARASSGARDPNGQGGAQTMLHKRVSVLRAGTFPTPVLRVARPPPMVHSPLCLRPHVHAPPCQRHVWGPCIGNLLPEQLQMLCCRVFRAREGGVHAMRAPVRILQKHSGVCALLLPS